MSDTQYAQELFGYSPSVTEGPVTTDLGTRGPAATIEQVLQLSPADQLAVSQARGTGQLIQGPLYEPFRGKLGPFGRTSLGDIGLGDVVPGLDVGLAWDDVKAMQAREEAGLDVTGFEKVATKVAVPLSAMGIGGFASKMGRKLARAAQVKRAAQKRPSILDAPKVTSRAGGKRMVGAPAGIHTTRQLNQLNKSLMKLTQEGEAGRFWYERSGRAILDMFGDNKQEAERFVRVLAATSGGGQTEVPQNLQYALQAWHQHKVGQPIRVGRWPTAQSARVQNILDNDVVPTGMKENPFYQNLMSEIDPSVLEGKAVTADLWIGRAFGYKSATISKKQHEFIATQIQSIADDVGWTPHQVQAAIWVAYKGKAQKGLDLAKRDFADYIGENMGQISWEAMPHPSTGHIPQIHNAPWEVRAEYTKSAANALLDSQGNDVIAGELGLISPGNFEAPGFYEGVTSPGVQSLFAAPRKYKGATFGEVDDATLDLMETYAATRGILLRQEGVGWHRAWYGDNIPAKRRDGAEIIIGDGRPMTTEETTKFAGIMKELVGHGEYNPVGSTRGVKVINFAFLKADNVKFQNNVAEALRRMDIADDVEHIRFASQNGMPITDWKEAVYGQGYFEGRLKERPDLQRRVRDLVQKYGERIDAVDADFATKHGWEITRTHAEDVDGFWNTFLVEDTAKPSLLGGVPITSKPQNLPGLLK